MSCHEYARVFLAFCCARIIVTCVHSHIRTISYSNLPPTHPPGLGTAGGPGGPGEPAASATSQDCSRGPWELGMVRLISQA